MRYFYKYMSAETALTVLANSTLKFSHPHNFNDPFDYHPTVDAVGMSKFYKRTRTENGWENELEPANSKLLRKNLKVLRSEEFRIESSKLTSISCFSKSKDILPMWAHYGDNHKGCVIGFRIPSEEEVAEMRKVPQWFFNPTYLVPQEVIYSDSRPKLYNEDGFTNTPTSGHNACFIKAMQWEYEEEVRVVKIVPEGIYSFPISQLISVHIGMNTHQENIDRIKKLVSHVNSKEKLSIKLFQTVMEYNTFKLSDVKL